MIPSAYFSSSVDEFLACSPAQILGEMTSRGNFALELDQRNAWEREIEILRSAFEGIQGRILLEYDIPRIGSRIDAVLLTTSVIFPIEFKVGEHKYRRADFEQVWDYALDLRNFHRASHTAPIVPVLVCTEACTSDNSLTQPYSDGVHSPLRTNPSSLRQLILSALSANKENIVDIDSWEKQPYAPTPTIIQAARSLYSRHSVDAISKSDAGAKNLTITSKKLESIIQNAAKNKKKAIVFITGVPGAGKTLVGLNIATAHRDESEATHTVFLSGNAPLVQVLSEALTRDEVVRSKAQGKSKTKAEIRQRVKAFIQNVHHFRDAGLRDESAPYDRVVVFDEAQRAWNQRKTTDFMARRKRIPGFSQSEPEFLISYMDRHEDWAVVVCLVGGGQEIHSGEAGISAWLDAIRERFPDWEVHISPELTDSEYAAGHALDKLSGVAVVHLNDELHLSVSMRSFRAESVSRFVKALLDCEKQGARALFDNVSARYPIVLTRNLERAKNWIRDNARGSERYGLVASSSAQRLKPHAIDVRVNVNPVHWFLNDWDDTRSSFFLEDAATEFQVQGLELDWVCMTWDADLRFEDTSWRFKRFRGRDWQNIKNLDAQRYLINAYRVLLTRARQGMVVFVPKGDISDHTRRPDYYDGTFEYLRSLNIPVI